MTMSLSDRQAMQAHLDRQVVPLWHIPDDVRVGVLAGADEHSLWLQGHFMRCEGCRAPLIALLNKRGAVGIRRPAETDCATARHSLFRYLEGGPDPSDEAFAHIVACDLCDDLFFEPAQAVILLEFEPEDVGEAG